MRRRLPNHSTAVGVRRGAVDAGEGAELVALRIAAGAANLYGPRPYEIHVHILPRSQGNVAGC